MSQEHTWTSGTSLWGELGARRKDDGELQQQRVAVILMGPGAPSSPPALPLVPDWSPDRLGAGEQPEATLLKTSVHAAVFFLPQAAPEFRVFALSLQVALDPMHIWELVFPECSCCRLADLGGQEGAFWNFGGHFCPQGNDCTWKSFFFFLSF